ncbi:hypothetical protein C8R43DRAFT_951070 [Mycena crocata]|nr:hypothetical protein C8R43DRAFT_951070 [Mycena crocata]
MSPGLDPCYATRSYSFGAHDSFSESAWTPMKQSKIAKFHACRFTRLIIVSAPRPGPRSAALPASMTPHPRQQATSPRGKMSPPHSVPGSARRGTPVIPAASARPSAPPASAPSRPVHRADHPTGAATIHLGPNAFGRYTKMRHNTPAAAGSSSSHVTESVSARLLFNDATRRLYTDASTAVREMGVTGAVRVVDLEAVEEYMSGGRDAL